VQAIENPFGITVHGVAEVRTEPDVAEVKLGISRLATSAAQAFEDANGATAAVRQSLRRSGLSDDMIEVARVKLESAYEGHGHGRKFLGYQSSVRLRLVIRELNALEDVLSDAVAAGANEVESVSYLTTRLGELRAGARRRAVDAARAKAEIYCAAAEVRLGHVLHIEDVNPPQESFRGHDVLGSDTDDAAGPSVLQSGSLTISAAVKIAFALVRS